jgi:glycosyltransferase involved in cell wall biosynthesis
MNKLLVIGRTIEGSGMGGVRIHVSRLLQLYDKFDMHYDFLDLDVKKKIYNICPSILKANIVYLHSASPILRCLISIFCLFTFKKLLIMVHGDLGRFNFFKNKLDFLSIKLCYKPLLINEKSFLKGLNLNKNSKLVSAYIPPIITIPLDKELTKRIEIERQKSKLIVVTNASHVNFDKFKKEIYGISALLKYFKSRKNIFFIVADPSGNYKKYIASNFPGISNVGFFINKKIDFYELLKLSDVFIRNTTTDGDSLSIREALELNVACYATNVVSRPHGTIVYDSLKDLTINKHTLKKEDRLSLYYFFKIQQEIIES